MAAVEARRLLAQRGLNTQIFSSCFWQKPGQAAASDADPDDLSFHSVHNLWN